MGHTTTTSCLALLVDRNIASSRRRGKNPASDFRIGCTLQDRHDGAGVRSPAALSCNIVLCRGLSSAMSDMGYSSVVVGLLTAVHVGRGMCQAVPMPATITMPIYLQTGVHAFHHRKYLNACGRTYTAC